MTNIRKHGFDSDAQWREYLEEIDDKPVASPALETHPRIIQVLADLRAELDVLRQRIQPPALRRKLSLGWSLVAIGCLFAIRVHRR